MWDLFFAHECKSNCTDTKSCNRDPNVVRAKVICSTCPVISHCRFWAVIDALPSGIAGGMTVKERRKLRRSLKAAGFVFNDYKRAADGDDEE